MLIDRAYLPVATDSTSNVLSEGRLWAKQGIKVVLSGTDQMLVGEEAASLYRKYYSPHMPFKVPLEAVADDLNLMVHMRGASKLVHNGTVASTVTDHLRFAHLHDEKLSKVTGKQCRRRSCHICLLFKMRSPSAPPRSAR